MKIDVRKEQNGSVAKVRGRIDTMSAEEFGKGLEKAAAEEKTLLVLDLSDLEYISSAGLRVMLSAGKKMKAAGGEVRLAALQGTVQKVFQISGFLTLFKAYDTPEQALRRTE